MELVEIDLALPPIFYEIEDLMNKLKSGKNVQWKIAGGSLSNLYMGKEVKDIDIFLDIENIIYSAIGEKEEPLPEKLSKLFAGAEVTTLNELVHGYHGWHSIPELYQINYKGYVLEFIPCSIERIYDFDLRFREFYFHDSKVFASTGALRDIENKTLTIVNPRSPLSTFSRVCRFEEQFGFQLAPKSLPYLLSYCNYLRIDYERFNDYIQNCEKYGKDVQQRMYDIFKTGTKIQRRPMSKELIVFNDAVFPFAPSLRDILFNQLKNGHSVCLGIFYNDLEDYVEEEQLFTTPLEYRLFQPEIEAYVQRINHMVTTYNTPAHRLHLVLSGVTFFELPPLEDLSHHLSLYFGNQNIANLIKYASKKDEFLYEDLHFATNLVEIPTVFQAKLVPNYDTYVPLGDVLRKNAMVINFRNGLAFRMRKCTNGKYTISGLMESSNGKGELILLNGIGQMLQNHFPEVFDFGNPTLQGIFSYDGGNFALEHFFKNEKRSRVPHTFLNNPIKEKIYSIHLKRKSE